MKQCFSRKMSSKPPCETPWRPFKLHPLSVRAMQPTVLSGSLAAAWVSDIPSSAALLLLHSPPSLISDQSSCQAVGQAMPLELGCSTDTQRHSTHTRSHQMLRLCFCKCHHMQSCSLVTQHKAPLRSPDRAGDQWRSISQNRDCARAG